MPFFLLHNLVYEFTNLFLFDDIRKMVKIAGIMICFRRCGLSDTRFRYWEPVQGNEDDDKDEEEKDDDYFTFFSLNLAVWFFNTNGLRCNSAVSSYS